MHRIVLSLVMMIMVPLLAWAGPVLNFSDLDSGPKTGNTDGVGSGAIVTIWGNNLGSSQGASKVYVGGVEATAIYYWKDADGALPGGPADLKTYHKMQEVAFAVPAGAPDGATTITVAVGGVESNTLPFTVRTGNIRYIRSGGANSGAGTWSTPWATVDYIAAGAGGVLAAGDIVYIHGVALTAGMRITAGIGASGNPVAVVAYPNTAVSFSGLESGGSGYTVYNPGSGGSGYWNWSKLSFTTTGSGLTGFRDARYVGLNMTGPAAYAGYSGMIGGSNNINCGGLKLYGLEIHHYGVANGVDTIGNASSEVNGATWSQFQHAIYLSGRSSTLQIEGYEVGWCYFHDNPMYQQIHVYDMGDSIGWTTPIRIHHNVVANGRGNLINIDLSAQVATPVVIHDNLTISNSDDVYTYRGLNVIRYNAAAVTTIYNNTFVGHRVVNNLSGGIIDYRNNIVYDTKNVAYIAGTPATQSNNLFFSTVNAALAVPSWAAGALNVDPRFTAAASRDFSLAPGSPALDAGSDTTATAPRDFLGNDRDASPAIGAFDVAGSPPVVNGSCGASNGAFLVSAPVSGLCSSGTPSGVIGAGPWTWSCVGSNGGGAASCSAAVQAQPGVGYAVSTATIQGGWR